jgi:hypothetical protein
MPGFPLLTHYTHIYVKQKLCLRSEITFYPTTLILQGNHIHAIIMAEHLSFRLIMFELAGAQFNQKCHDHGASRTTPTLYFSVSCYK